MRKKVLRNKGIMLLFAFIIVSFLLILLTVSISQMQNSVFLTKRMEARMKAEWAAMAGLEYAEACITNNIKWPFAGACPSVGDYTVTTSTQGDCVIIKAVSTKSDSDFCIAFRNISPTISIPSSFVPSSKASLSGKEIDIYSYTGEGSRTFSGGRTVYTNGFKAHTIKCPASSGVFVGVEGRSGAYKSFAEKLYKVEHIYEDYAAALFVQNSLNAHVTGKIGISQTGGRRPSIIALGGLNVTSDNFNTPDRDGNGPLMLQQGAIFTNANSVQVGTASITTGATNNRGTYGVRVEKARTTSKPQEKMPEAKGTVIPAGQYSFWEIPKTEISPLQELLLKVLPEGDFLQKYLAELKIEADKTYPPLAPEDKRFEFVYLPESVTVGSITVEDYQNAKILLEIEKQLANKGYPWGESRGKLAHGVRIIEEAEAALAKIEANPFSNFFAKRNLFIDIEALMNPLKEAEYNGTTYSDDDIRAVLYYQCQQELKPISNGEFVPIGATGENLYCYEYVPRASFSKPTQTSFEKGFPFKPDVGAVDLALTDDVDCKGKFIFQTTECSSFQYKPAERVRSTINLTNSKKQLGARTDIDIAGCIKGEGVVVAGTNIKIEAGGNLASDDIALYANRDIEIIYPSTGQIGYAYAASELRGDIANSAYAAYFLNPELDTNSDEFVAKTKEFSDTYEPSGNNLNRTVDREDLPNFITNVLNNETWDYSPSSNLKGIIYAKYGNILINPKGGTVAFEGVIVCGGDFTVENAANIGIRYNTESAHITETIPAPGGGSDYSLSEIFCNTF